MAYEKVCDRLSGLVLSTWGASGAFRNLFRGKWFTCVLYHRVDTKTFKAHIAYYSKNYSLCSLDYLRRFYQKEDNLPRNPLFITFDDGWKSNYELLSLLEEHDVPITIFLTTGLIGSNMIPHPINIFEESKIEAIESSYPIESERTMLTVNEIREMSKIVDFQAHGVHHHLSTRISEEKLKIEIKDSKESIEKITGKPVFAFAYPYNRAGEREARIVESCGLSLARAGGRTLNRFDTNQYLLNSIGIPENCTVKQLQNKLLRAELKTIRGL